MAAGIAGHRPSRPALRDAAVLGSAGVPPAVFGILPNTLHPRWCKCVEVSHIGKEGKHLAARTGKPNLSLIDLFRNRFLPALRDGKHVSPSRLADLLSWKHSGFHIDGGGETPVASHDADGRKRFAEYLLRQPFSLRKITSNATTHTVIYRSKRHHTAKRNFLAKRAG